MTRPFLTAGIAGTIGRYVIRRVPPTTLKDYPDREGHGGGGAGGGGTLSGPGRRRRRRGGRPLRKRYLALEVIPADKLDLDAPR